MAKQFEYQVGLHPPDEFKELVFVCTSTGDCKAEQVVGDQTTRLQALLNQQGRKGWELVQAVFGKNGLVTIWQREVQQ